MLSTILKYELKYWLKQPAIYLYAIVVFSLAFITISEMASETSARFGGRELNSISYLFNISKRFMYLIILIIPAVMGYSVYRDFSTKMHTILYSFPFGKREYLFAKLASAFVVLIVISSMMGIGYFLGTQVSTVNPDLVQSFKASIYFQLYGLYILPNIFLVGTMIFSVVLLSRNIYAGFIVTLLFILFQQMSGQFSFGDDTGFWIGLFDPTCGKAFNYYTHNWNVMEQNSLLLPMHGLVIWNRLLWIGMAFLVLVFTFKYFQFHQNGISFFTKAKENKTQRIKSLGLINRYSLTKASLDFSWQQQLKNIWQLSNFDFKFIATSKSFIILVMAGLALVILMMSSVNPRWGTDTLPMTWQILELPSMFYSGVINVITFLYAGLLVNRKKMVNINQLVDTNPVPNWVLMLSKYLALVKIQVLLLFIVMIGGILSQAAKGFYEFEIDQYLFNLYGLNLIHFMIWAMLALFIQTLIDNPYLGFFLLLFAPLGFIGMAEFGPKHFGLDFLEQELFRFNQVPSGVLGLEYSDMDGYGGKLSPYFIYKIYWSLAGILLLLIALLFWKRGLPYTFRERIKIAKQRFNHSYAFGVISIFLLFVSLGSSLYYDVNHKKVFMTKQQKKKELLKAEKKYRPYEYFPQPKITSVKINIDIFPNERQFKATGEYWAFNKTTKNIDTLIINYLTDLNTTYDFDRKYQVVLKDTIATFSHFDLLVLEESLAPGDSLRVTFNNYNNNNTWLQNNDFVKKHGTYIEDDIFPRFGNWLSFIRENNDFGGNNNRPHPSDSTALVHSMMSKDADYIDFEAVVSTSKDQHAIAPGSLEKEWIQNDRRYFHYKVDSKIALSYLFTSGRYAIKKDKWKDIDLEIYYHKDHPYNIDRMMDGLKAGLSYCTENFSPYQFKQVKIIEFAQVRESTAHGFPNTIPAGEGSGFIADIDDSANGGTDYAFGVAAHEVAHQWWGHQVIPADVLGAKMVVESLAEYVNIKVKEKEKGVAKMRKFLKYNLEQYLRMRTRQSRIESPLMYVRRDENYISYPKGSNVFYTLGNYIGDENLNQAIKTYVEKVKFQEGTYTTAVEMVNNIKQHVPDSLQYLIRDMFETVTLYDNKIIDWKSRELENGKHQVDIKFSTRKYRSGKGGIELYSDFLEPDSISFQSPQTKETVYSLPLADYIDIGIFTIAKKEIFLEKIKVDQIDNTISILVDEKPEEVAIDPYFKLIDRELIDNWKK